MDRPQISIPIPGSRLLMASIGNMQGDEVTRRDLARLSRAPSVVSATGGAGYMSSQQGLSAGRSLAEGLGGAQANASVLAGATMVITRPGPQTRCSTCKA